MIREIQPPDTAAAFEAMRALRAGLADEEAFARRVDEVQRPEGYRLVGAFEEGEATAVRWPGSESATASPGTDPSTSTTSRPCPRRGAVATAAPCSIGALAL
jgi:hypothetical protein